MEPKALGRQVLAEFTGCDPARLSDPSIITEAMLRAAEATGATIVAHSFHHFSPHGVSGAVIIAESHLAIHTWPEYGYAAADVFTCGETVDPWAALESLKADLGAGQVSMLELRRGQLGLPGLRHKVDDSHHNPLQERVSAGLVP